MAITPQGNPLAQPGVGPGGFQSNPPTPIPGLVSFPLPQTSAALPSKLIDLKTNLKSLRFGNDQPDGGSSNSPYVWTDLPENATPLERFVINSSVVKINRSFDFNFLKKIHLKLLNKVTEELLLSENETAKTNWKYVINMIKLSNIPASMKNILTNI